MAFLPTPIGYGPLAFGGRMEVDECGPRAVVAHVLHQFAEARARVSRELVAGMAQVVKVNAGQADSGKRGASRHGGRSCYDASARRPGYAGRPSPRIVCSLPVCVTSDPAAARASADKELAIYGQLPSYRAMLDREGAAGLGDVAIVGDEDAVAAQIAELADAGVTDFTAAQFAHGPDRERTRNLLKTLIAAS